MPDVRAGERVKTTGSPSGSATDAGSRGPPASSSVSGVLEFPLETPRLVIRPLVLDDAYALHELFSDRSAMRFLTVEVPQTLAESRAWVQSKIDLHERDDGMSLWAVIDRVTGSVLGDAGLQWEEIGGEREVDLGCRIIPRYWGRGYATEAGEACLRVAFEQLALPRVTAMTAVGNVPAQRVLEKIGMRRERELYAHGFRMALYAAERPALG